MQLLYTVLAILFLYVQSVGSENSILEYIKMLSLAIITAYVCYLHLYFLIINDGTNLSENINDTKFVALKAVSHPRRLV